MKHISLIYLLLFLFACSVSAPTMTISKLLSAQAVLGGPIDIDAYWTPILGGTRSSGTANTACAFDGMLTERPMLPVLRMFSSSMLNIPPASEPYLVVAMTPEMPAIPYHAHLYGHLDSHIPQNCPYANQTFVVDNVVKVYEQTEPWPMPFPQYMQLPGDYIHWIPYRNKQQAYQFRYPPYWQLQVQHADADSATLTIQPSHGDLAPIVITSRRGAWRETPTFRQGWVFGGPINGHGPLWANILMDTRCQDTEDMRSIRAVFSENSTSVMFLMHYRTGSDASQQLLDEYTALIESFSFEPLDTHNLRDNRVPNDPTWQPSAEDMAWLCGK